MSVENNKKSNKKISSEVSRLICIDYINNISIKDIAKKYNIHYNTARKILNKKTSKKIINEIIKENKKALQKVINKNSLKLASVIDKIINNIDNDKKINESNIYTLSNLLLNISNFMQKSEMENINIKKNKMELKRLKLELEKYKMQVELLKNQNASDNIKNDSDNSIIFKFYERLRELSINIKETDNDKNKSKDNLQ